MGRFLAEAQAEAVLRAEAERQVEQAALERARAALERAIPADVLEALGLDLAALTLERGTARVTGRIAFEGMTLKTAASEGSYNRVELSIDDEPVGLKGNVRANVGQVLEKLAWRKQMNRLDAANRLLHGAQQWPLTDPELGRRNLTRERLPLLTAEEVATVRGLVAQRRWAAHERRRVARAKERAKDAAQERRAAALLEAVAAWRAVWAAHEEDALAWARRWTTQLEASVAPLYRVRYGAPAAACEEDDERADWQAVTTLEAPTELGPAVNGLVRVRAVSLHGGVWEKWIGAILDVTPLASRWPAVMERLDWHDSVRCGRAVVNVPPLAPAGTAEAARQDRPTEPATIQAWLIAQGFRPEWDVMRWWDDVVATLREMRLPEAVEVVRQAGHDEVDGGY